MISTHWRSPHTPADNDLRFLDVLARQAADLMERRSAEEETAKSRKESEEALHEADRRKNEFLAILAHELRGPLAPIRNGLQVLRMPGARAEDVTSATAIMERQLGHMARLIDDLIDISRISRGKLQLRREPTDLISVARSVAEATLPICDAMRHELRVTFPSEPIYVDADPTRLAQVVGNLLNNACKFTTSGGRISLVVEQDHEEVLIRVQDTGIGISADYLPRVFDLFTQADSSIERTRSGLGIGLSLVKDVVEMHGGSVSVESAGPGQGSEFIVRLPVLVDPTRPGRLELVDAAEPLVSRRILVVDDNHDSADSLAVLLTLKGHDVHSAHDGLAAVEEAAKLHPDLILLDIGLPCINGFEAARRIRKQPGGEDVKLVALTGWGQEDYRRRSEEAGFNAHLVKPVAPEDLDRVLATLIPGEEDS
jgi:signal transduction histidine kinase/ActR/RegA family two-component response regulator